MIEYFRMTTIANLSVQQLRRAVTLKEKIQSLEKKLSQLLGSTSSVEADIQAPKKKKRAMSAAAKAKISAKLKKAWALRKAAKK